MLTLFGGYAAGQLNSRWYQSLAVPGKSAYEASHRTFKALGAGVRSPSKLTYPTSFKETYLQRAGWAKDDANSIAGISAMNPQAMPIH